jgi:hypothetical protein
MRVPASDVSIGRLSTQGKRFALRSVAGSANLDVEATIDLDHMLISAEQRNLSVEQARGVLERLIVFAGDGQLRPEPAASSALGARKLQGPAVSIEALETVVDSLNLQAEAGVLSLHLVAGVDVGRVFECRSTFDPADQGHPRAEALF